VVAKLANNASSTLASAINNVVTTVSIASGDASKFPALAAGEWFPLTVVDASGNIEVMRVTARSSATLTVVRGQEGTTARAFAAGSKCDLRLTAAAALAPALATDATAVTQAAGNSSKAVANTEFIQNAAVRVDASQSFTQAQRGQARANIGGSILAGFRNKLINGDFDIWQRGTSFAQSAGGYTADRWTSIYAGAPANITHSRQSFPVGQADVPGNPKFFYRITNTSIGSVTLQAFEQRIEGVETLSGKQVTLTFFMKASAAFTLEASLCRLYQNFGTGGSPSPQVDNNFVGALSDTAVTTSWKKFTVTRSLPSIAGKTLGSNGNDYLRLYLALPMTVGLSIDIAHVSLVEGDATAEDDPFAPRHPQQEVALCQRYYQERNGVFRQYTTNVFRLSLPLPVPLRGNPTLAKSYSASAGVQTDNASATSTELNLDYQYTSAGSGAIDVVFTFRLDAEL
jgi:hypothetical protein